MGALGSILQVILGGNPTVVNTTINFLRATAGILIPPRGSADPGSGQQDFEIFLRTDTGELKYWDGAAWQLIVGSAAAGSVDHGALLGLGDAVDHPWAYERGGANGALTANLLAGGFKIQNLTGSVNVHGSAAVDPVSPTPVAGDLYFNTVLREWMYYDGIRAKWLSVAVRTVLLGRNGNTAAAQGYRAINGMILTTPRGIPVEQGTLTAIKLQTDTAVSSVLEVFHNPGTGSNLLGTLAHTTIDETIDNTLNADFPQGYLQARNAAGGGGGATTTNVQIALEWRRRA